MQNGKTEGAFFDSLPLGDISEILIIAHTGQKFIERLENKLNSDSLTQAYPIKIKALLKSPGAESQDRSQKIMDTISLLKKIKTSGYDVETRFYDTLPFYRCVLCKLKTGKVKCLVSSYTWLPQFKTAAYTYNFVFEAANGNKKLNLLYDLVKSWFDHYWGNEEIHTLIFDFDDTIVKTFDVQIDAWCRTFINLIENGEIVPEICSSGIRENLNNYEKLRAYVREVFIEHQMAAKMFSVFFPNLPENHSDIRLKVEIARFEERCALTLENSSLIENVAPTLAALKEKYQLVIISATSETMIKDILRKNGIDSYFSMILGKNGPKPDWDNIYEKSGLMIKLTKLTGIGLDRMVFIGDNDSDYRSARQLQVCFIESRAVAIQEGIGTLIKYTQNEKQIYFENYQGNQLELLLEEINDRLKEKLKCY